MKPESDATKRVRKWVYWGSKKDYDNDRNVDSSQVETRKAAHETDFDNIDRALYYQIERLRNFLLRITGVQRLTNFLKKNDKPSTSSSDTKSE